MTSSERSFDQPLVLDDAALTRLVNEAVEHGPPELRRAARLLAHWASRAEASASNYYGRERFWRRLSWALTGGAASLATLAGTGAVALGQLPSSAKYLVAAASLGSAMLEGLASVLRPAQRQHEYGRRAREYLRFRRRTWSYILTALQHSSAEEIAKRLDDCTIILADLGGPVPDSVLTTNE